jgi:hypothetical protein
VSDEELRRLLVDAVPELRPPADRWTAIGARVRRHRHRQLALVLVFVLTLGFGTTLVPDPSAPDPRPAGVPYDPARIPAGSPGSAAPRVVHTTERPPKTPDGDGIFRTVCLYSHMADEGGYLRTHWGDTGTGRSTCRGGTVDRSTYWVPALIDTRTGTPLAPDLVHVYFESGYFGVRPDEVQPLPAGLSILAGGPEHAWWSCWADSPHRSATIPASCPAGIPVALELYFPQCWDGGTGLAYSVPAKGCPAGYPVALPQISYHVLYPAPTGTTGWRLASDRIEGGWVNGWDPDIATAWTLGCVRAAVTCGSHLLGDGRALEGDR